MNGSEVKYIRKGLSEAIDRTLSITDMAKLCGLKDPDGNGRKRYRQWEEDAEPIPGPAAILLSLYLACVDSDREDRGVFMRDYIRERVSNTNQ